MKKRGKTTKRMKLWVVLALVISLVAVQTVQIIAEASEEGSEASGVSVTVSSISELIDAVENAADGDVIGIDSKISIDTNVGQIGSEGGKHLTIIRMNEGAYFDVSSGGNVTFCNMAFEGNGSKVIGNMSMFYVLGTLNLNSVVVKNCSTANGNGGAVYVDMTGTLNADQAVFDRNAGYRGGHIYATGTAFLRNCILKNGRASTEGGAAMSSHNGALDMSGCKVYGNAASTSGGGIHNNAAATLTRCAVFANTAFAGADIANDTGVTAFRMDSIADSLSLYEEDGITPVEWVLDCENGTDGLTFPFDVSNPNSLMKLVYEGSLSGDDTGESGGNTEESGGTEEGGNTEESGGSTEGGGNTEGGSTEESGGSTESGGNTEGSNTEEGNGSTEGGGTEESGGSTEGGNTEGGSTEEGSGSTEGGNTEESGSTEEGGGNTEESSGTEEGSGNTEGGNTEESGGNAGDNGNTGNGGNKPEDGNNGGESGSKPEDSNNSGGNGNGNAPGNGKPSDTEGTPGTADSDSSKNDGASPDKESSNTTTTNTTTTNHEDNSMTTKTTENHEDKSTSTYNYYTYNTPNTPSANTNGNDTQRDNGAKTTPNANVSASASVTPARETATSGTSGSTDSDSGNNVSEVSANAQIPDNIKLDLGNVDVVYEMNGGISNIEISNRRESDEKTESVVAAMSAATGESAIEPDASSINWYEVVKMLLLAAIFVVVIPKPNLKKKAEA